MRTYTNWSIAEARSEFLERTNLVLYPPPLHCLSWEVLDEAERKIALRDLKGIARRDLSGFFPTQPEIHGDPYELRPWNSMDVWERRAVFKTLQVFSMAPCRHLVLIIYFRQPRSRINEKRSRLRFGLYAEPV